MANIAPAFVVVNPSYVMPELLLPYTQASGAFDLLATGEPMTRLSDGDLFVYVKRVDVRTKMASGQSAYNNLPSASVTMSQISTPTYLFRVRAEYDHHDTAAMGRWGVSIVEAQRLAMQQGHVQLLRSALLYGMNPANGEGLLNTQGATAVPLPPDPNGNDTVVTYDNGAMAFFLIAQIQALKTRTNQLGIGRKFTICGPQRVLGQFEYQDIVQLVQYQRPGAGSSSTAGVVKDVLKMNGDEIMWVYDDTLIGKGTAGTDAVIITMPEVAKPNGGKLNTNKFAELSPGLSATTLQLTDMAAPKEITAPLAGGAIDVLSELRATSGWAIRPEVVTIVSMQYQ
jgi:hypothetical protein